MMLTKEQYRNVVKSWKKVREHNVIEHVIYNVLRNKNPDLGFVAFSTQGGLQSHDQDPWYTYNMTISQVTVQLSDNFYNVQKYIKKYSELFGVEFTSELREHIISVLKSK